MKILKAAMLWASLLLIAGPGLCASFGYSGYGQDAGMTQAAGKTTVLNPAGLAKLLPATVYFKGQTAPTQARNSGGVRFADNTFMFVAMVDASGYSTAVQDKYQAYLVTDVPLMFGGQVLPPGAYGCGFRSGDQFVVMDIGGKDILSAPTQKDAAMRRPTPLQVLAGDSAENFRIYEGRSSVTFSRAVERP